MTIRHTVVFIELLPQPKTKKEGLPQNALLEGQCPTSHSFDKSEKDCLNLACCKMFYLAEVETADQLVVLELFCIFVKRGVVSLYKVRGKFVMACNGRGRIAHLAGEKAPGSPNFSITL